MLTCLLGMPRMPFLQRLRRRKLGSSNWQLRHCRKSFPKRTQRDLEWSPTPKESLALTWKKSIWTFVPSIWNESSWLKPRNRIMVQPRTLLHVWMWLGRGRKNLGSLALSSFMPLGWPFDQVRPLEHFRRKCSRKSMWGDSETWDPRHLWWWHLAKNTFKRELLKRYSHEINTLLLKTDMKKGNRYISDRLWFLFFLRLWIHSVEMARDLCSWGCPGREDQHVVGLPPCTSALWEFRGAFEDAMIQKTNILRFPS